MQKVSLSLLAALAIGGCAYVPTPRPVTQQPTQKTILACLSAQECEIKWAAAQRWILDNAGYQLKTVSADCLETYSATGGSPVIAVRVAKEPLSSGGYRLVAEIWCDNMFGCVPDAEAATAAFNREVGAAFAAVK